MSKTIFIDTDIILDLLLQREPFFEPALLLFSEIEAKRVKAHVSALIIWNIYYLVEKHASRKQARQKVAQLRMLLSIIPVDEKIIDSALQSDFKDLKMLSNTTQPNQGASKQSSLEIQRTTALAISP